MTSIGTMAFAGIDSLETMVFEGNAPKADRWWAGSGSPDFIIYYHQEATGFSAPFWGNAPCYPLGPAPTPPIHLTASIGSDQVTLFWEEPFCPGDSAIDRHIIYQDDVQMGTSVDRSAIVTGLASGEAHIFRVAAQNAAGTGPSSSAFVATLAGPVIPGGSDDSSSGSSRTDGAPNDVLSGNSVPIVALVAVLTMAATASFLVIRKR